MPAAKRKAAPPPPPAELLKKSRKSQIIDRGGVPPLPVGIIRPKDGQPPKPEQPKPDRALHLVISLKPAPVPEAASSSGHVKGDGKGGSKTGHWSSMEQADLSTEGHSDLRHQVFSLRPVVSCVIQYEPWAILLCSEDLVTCPEMLMHFLKCLFPPPAALLQADEGPPPLVDSSSDEGPPPLVGSSSESVESGSLLSDSDSD